MFPGDVLVIPGLLHSDSDAGEPRKHPSDVIIPTTAARSLNGVESADRVSVFYSTTLMH
jgi:hypothetical protein